jgi:hypothetical protein
MNNESSFFENNLIKFLIKIISTISIIFLTYYIFYENLYKRRNLSNEVIVQNTITTDTVIINTDTAAISINNQINFNYNDSSFYTIINLEAIQNLNLSSDSLKNISESILKNILPRGLVNDYYGILSQSQSDSLQKLLEFYDYEFGLQIAVITLYPFMYNDLQNFSTSLFNRWGIGNKETNYGILFVYDIVGGKIKILNGLGVEKIYTVKETQNIIDKNKTLIEDGNTFDYMYQSANQIATEVINKSKFIKKKKE